MTFYPEFNPEFIPEFYPEFIPASVYIVDLHESDEPQTPWVSVTRVRNTSVGTWKPKSGYEEAQGHLKKSQALEGCSRKGEWPEGPVSTAG